MRADFITPDSPRWLEVLADTDYDFYHLPEYVDFCSKHEGGDAFAFLAEDESQRFLVPLILRPVKVLGKEWSRFYDVTCPYGYPGPLLVTDPHRSAQHFPARALRALLGGLRQLNVVSAFFRLHPTLALPVEPLANNGCVVQHGETVLINLTLSSEEIWRQTRPNHRRGINRAKRAGQVAHIDEHWEEFDTFIDIYAQTMRRVGAGEYYHFSRDYFAELRQVLGNLLHLCVVRIGGEVVCAGLFSEVSGIVQYHLGGTKEKALIHHPTKIMFDFLRHWAKERRNRVLHLGGGVEGKKDTLFAFKAGFSKLRKPFFSWRVVVDEKAYSTLVKHWESCSGVKADGFQGYFPSYRKPIVIQDDQKGNVSETAHKCLR